MFHRPSILTAALVLSVPAFATGGGSYDGPGTCPTDGTTTYEMMNGDKAERRVIWMPKAFCSGTALFSMLPGNELWHNEDLTDGGFTGVAKVVTTGCSSGDPKHAEYKDSTWNVSFDLVEKATNTVPKSPRGSYTSWKIQLVRNGRMIRKDKTSSKYFRFDNAPSSDKYGNQIGVGANPVDYASEFGGAFWFDYWYVKDNGGCDPYDGPYTLLHDAHGDFNYDLLECEEDDCPVDDTNPLGPATGFNVYTVEDLDVSNSDIGGKTAVGGDGYASNYGFNSNGGSGSALHIAGDFQVTNSQLYGTGGGDAGSCSVMTSFGTPNSTFTCSGASFDAGSSDNVDQLDAILDWVATQSVGAPSASLNMWWPQLIIDGGTGSGPQFINVDTCAIESAITSKWSWASNIQGWDIKGGTDATLIINMTGGCHDYFFQNGYMGVSGGVDKSDIIWVVQSDEPVDIRNVSLQGSLFAPKADVTFNSANIDGTLVALNLDGSGESHEFTFDGDICPVE